jgi:hypothetical protein
VLLKDGMGVVFEVFQTMLNPDCASPQYGDLPALSSVCGSIFVDVNGAKPPNVLGKDLFSFYLTTKGIIPRGTAQQTGDYSFDNSCKNATQSGKGYSCAAWVIYNENMDYLHCNDLSWSGKLKCD